MSGTQKILLLDGYSTRTLACVRSWGKREIPFVVGGETRWDMSLSSRFTRETFVYTSPKTSVAQFIGDVNRWARHFGADCVFPTSEATIMACDEHRGELAAAPIIPEHDHIRTLFSKTATLKLAESVGIRVPKTVHVAPHEVQALEAIELDFPVAIKSESSEVLGVGHAVTARKTAYVSNRVDLLRECRSRLDAGNGILLQEFIDGYGLGISGLFDRGEPVALLGHRRLRESDPLGGPSALAETVPLPLSLLEPSLNMMRRIGYRGPAMIEYKVDRRTETPYFMEVNGRFWGTILLAPAAGLDLPYLYWKLINGVPIDPQETHYRTGVRGRYLIGDAKGLLLTLRGRPHSWPGHFTSRWPAIRDFFASFMDSHTHDLILTPEDPAPFFFRLFQELA